MVISSERFDRIREVDDLKVTREKMTQKSGSLYETSNASSQTSSPRVSTGS